MNIYERRKQNLIRLIGDYGRGKLARTLGYDDANYLNQLTSGNTRLGNRNAERFCRKLGLPPGWFDEEHLDTDARPSEEEIAWAQRNLRSELFEDRRRAIHILAAAGPGEGSYYDQLIAANSKDNPGMLPAGTNRVPHIAWADTAAYARDASPSKLPADTPRLACNAPYSAGCFAITLEGDAMSAPTGRTYPSGVIVFVDPEQTSSSIPGSRVLAETQDGRILFRELAADGNDRYLRALNPSHPPYYGEFEILGKIIGSWIPE